MTRNKKIALLTLPVFALVVFGSSVSTAYGRGISFDGLTSEQQSALEEARELQKNGESDEARKILKKAGVSHMMHQGFSRGKGTQKAMHGRHGALQAALDAHDYTAFKNATIDAPFAGLVTEASFSKLVEAHTLRKKGDKEGAQKILQGLGFPHKV